MYSTKLITALACFGVLVIEQTRMVMCMKWLSLASVSSLAARGNRQEFCDSFEGLERRQRLVCKNHVQVMDSVMKGANMSISECQYQFQHRRWNCSTVYHKTIFGNLLNQGSRESAFIHAIAAAGLAHAVTKTCSRGEVEECGCDRTVKDRGAEGFSWSGCSDNAAYGLLFSKAFTDARERMKTTNERLLMNLHNNEAGRKAIEESVRTECKCHGVSGSCEIKTCWLALPTFRDVGSILRDKFDGATEVKLADSTSSRKSLVPVNPTFKPHTASDLIYLEHSPDFCEPDRHAGSLGTQGRQCNRTSRALDGCDLMCCGREFSNKKRKVKERCECKFHWCCHVKCKECEQEVEENYCL